MSEEQTIQISQDGSHTLYSKKFNAHYHSVFGAAEESIHVFLSAGLFYLHQQQRDNISIFEMGFGTGLNAYLTALQAELFSMNINYECIESDPVNSDLFNSLNYPTQLNRSQAVFDLLHNSHWEKPIQINNHFNLIKHHASVQEFEFDRFYDLVYWDAFAPNCQSFLWEREIHQKIYNQLNTGGILVSYCSNAKFTKVLKLIGYDVQFLTGPAKKREMIRAIKR